MRRNVFILQPAIWTNNRKTALLQNVASNFKESTRHNDHSQSHAISHLCKCAKVDWCSLDLSPLLTGPEIIEEPIRKESADSFTSYICPLWVMTTVEVTCFRWGSHLKGRSAARDFLTALQHCPGHGWVTTNTTTVIQCLGVGIGGRGVAVAPVAKQPAKLQMFSVLVKGHKQLAKATNTHVLNRGRQVCV